jgi:hypothetical protein
MIKSIIYYLNLIMNTSPTPSTPSTVNTKLWNVAGIYFEPSSKKYILWTLKLMQDVPAIFGELVWGKDQKEIKDINKFGIIICDREDLLNKESLNPQAIIIYMKSKSLLI